MILPPGWSAERARALRERLARSYKTEQAQRRACALIGMDPMGVNFTGSAQDAWFSILTEASGKGLLPAFDGLPDNVEPDNVCPHCGGVLPPR